MDCLSLPQIGICRVRDKNGAVSLGLTTSGYLGAFVEAASTQAPASANQVVNEISHQYDIYNNTKLQLLR